MSQREPSPLTLAAYALPALPFAVLTLPLYVIVPAFYARELALPLAAVGQVLLGVRILDALSDPAAGVLADRWRPRFGRRRLWFLCASIPTALASWFLFTPPPDAGLAYLALWGALLSIAWTAALVPYAAWGAELSSSYAGRARVTAWREALGVLGTLLALSSQAVLPLFGVTGERAVLFAFALIVGAGLPLAALAAVTRVPEPADATRVRLPLRDGFGHMLANRAFLRLLLAFLLNGFANGFPATLFLFFVTQRLRAPEAVGPVLVLYLLCGIIGVPFWLALARRWSKHRVWCVAMLLASAFFGAAPLLGAGDVTYFGVICVGTGLALGADLILPPAIQADVIDADTEKSGEQRAGIYFAIWGLATKLALAGAVGLAFPVLAARGFDPAAAASGEAALATLAFLYAGLPVILKLAAIAVVWNFPLGPDETRALRARIEARG